MCKPKDFRSSLMPISLRKGLWIGASVAACGAVAAWLYRYVVSDEGTGDSSSSSPSSTNGDVSPVAAGNPENQPEAEHQGEQPGQAGGKRDDVQEMQWGVSLKIMNAETLKVKTFITNYSWGTYMHESFQATV